MLATNSKPPEIAMVTPEMAMSLLEHNKLNRPLSDQHVKRIAGQIVQGKWMFNGDTIKVSKDGNVLGGQHRLWAIVESKRSVPSVIVYGIEREAFATIDTLRRMRSGGDVLALAGVERHRGRVSSALRWLILWQRGKLLDWRDPSNRIENSDIEAAYAENPGMVNAVEKVSHLHPLTNTSSLAFIYFVMVNRNPEIADRMLSTLENPSGVSMDDPFFRLRVYFTSEPKRKQEALVIFALCIKAANLSFYGERSRTLTWRHQGANPEEFPKLDITPARR